MAFCACKKSREEWNRLHEEPEQGAAGDAIRIYSKEMPYLACDEGGNTTEERQAGLVRLAGSQLQKRRLKGKDGVLSS